MDSLTPNFVEEELMSSKPVIAILNSSSFGKHHPDQISRLEKFATLKTINVPANIDGESLFNSLGDVNGIIASVTPKIPKITLEKLQNLKLLARHGIGCDNVDLIAAKELGIPVSKVEGVVERDAVAELAVTLMMSCARYVVPGSAAVKASRWQDRSQFIGIEMRGKRIGLIGIGNIGSRVAEILKLGFQAEVIAYDPKLSPLEVEKRHAIPLSLEELVETSDIISFHCPLTNETSRLLNKDRLNRVKKGAILINTCRGELLDESALVEILEKGRLRAYGTDVVEGEPIDGSHRLLKLSNVVVLPHLGGYSVESLRGMGETMVRDCELVFLERKPPGVLANPEVLNKDYRKWG